MLYNVIYVCKYTYTCTHTHIHTLLYNIQGKTGEGEGGSNKEHSEDKEEDAAITSWHHYLCSMKRTFKSEWTPFHQDSGKEVG